MRAVSRALLLDRRSSLLRTEPGPALGRLLLPARLSGISIHCQVALDGLGGFGAGIGRRAVSPCRTMPISGFSEKASSSPKASQSAFASPMTTTLIVASLRGAAGGAWE